MIVIDRPDHFAIRFGRLLPPVLGRNAAGRGAAIGGDVVVPTGGVGASVTGGASPILFVSPPCAAFHRGSIGR